MHLVKEHMNFERGANPKKAMNVGTRVKIEQWLEDYFQHISHATEKSVYLLNDDLSIDINGFFITDWVENFPDFIQFNEIYGNFHVGPVTANNEKTTLRGCPKIVHGDFSCNGLSIKNLIGGPTRVDGTYNCSLNPKLVSFEGLATHIGDDFCCNNKSGLTEKDIPKETDIKGDINVGYWSSW